MAKATMKGSVTRRTPQRSTILPTNGVASAPIACETVIAEATVPRFQPNSATIGFRKTPKVNRVIGAIADDQSKSRSEHDPPWIFEDATGFHAPFRYIISCSSPTFSFARQVLRRDGFRRSRFKQEIGVAGENLLARCAEIAKLVTKSRTASRARIS